MTQQIKYKAFKIGNDDCIIVDCPGCDDSNHHDVHHANNLAAFLCGVSGVNAFVLVQNGTNIRLKGSLQAMIQQYEANFGAAFWSHLIVVLTNIEPHLLLADDDDDEKGQNEWEGIKHDFIEVLNETYPQSRNQTIPVINIGWQGYGEFAQWRTAFLCDAKQQIRGRIICDEMVPPVVGLRQRRDALRQRIEALQSEMDGLSGTMRDLTAEIERLRL